MFKLSSLSFRHCLEAKLLFLHRRGNIAGDLSHLEASKKEGKNDLASFWLRRSTGSKAATEVVVVVKQQGYFSSTPPPSIGILQYLFTHTQCYSLQQQVVWCILNRG